MHKNASCLTCEDITCEDIHLSLLRHHNVSRLGANGSCLTYKCIMSQIWRGHVSRWQSRQTPRMCTIHWRISSPRHHSVSCLTRECVRSHIWMRHVSLINESCRTLAHAKESSQHPLQHLDLCHIQPYTAIYHMCTTQIHTCIVYLHVHTIYIHISCMYNTNPYMYCVPKTQWQTPKNDLNTRSRHILESCLTHQQITLHIHRRQRIVSMTKVQVSFQMSNLKRDLWWPSTTAAAKFCDIPPLNVLCLTCEFSIFHMWMHHISHWRQNIIPTSAPDVWTSPVWQMNESCLTNQRVMSHVSTRQEIVSIPSPTPWYVQHTSIYNTHPCTIHVQHTSMYHTCTT